MGRQLAFLALGFVGGTVVALLLGAKNLGTAIAVGQLTFVLTLVWVLLHD